MLFTKKTKKDVMDVCDSIMNGAELTVKQLDAVYLFSSEVNDKIERKIAMVLETVHPSVWKEFYELEDFYIHDEWISFTYVSNDNELITFGFELKLLELSRKELEAEAENMQKD